MPREVEGLDNLNKILTLPIGSKFGMFADDSITLFNACFVFMDIPVGSVVTHPPVQNGTETFFISMNELNNTKI